MRTTCGTMRRMPPTKPNRARSDERRRVIRQVFPHATERPRFLSTRLLRAGEVAVLLQVSRRSIAAWARRGLIPFIETPGGHRRFRATDIRELVASLERRAPSDDGRESPA